MMIILNGGAHADGNVNLQEFMAMLRGLHRGGVAFVMFPRDGEGTVDDYTFVNERLAQYYDSPVIQSRPRARVAAGVLPLEQHPGRGEQQRPRLQVQPPPASRAS